MQNANGIVRGLNLVTDSAGIFIDFVIVSTGSALISEEVNLIEVLLNKLQAVAFVPALGENVE